MSSRSDISVSCPIFKQLHCSHPYKVTLEALAALKEEYILDFHYYYIGERQTLSGTTYAFNSHLFSVNSKKINSKVIEDEITKYSQPPKTSFFHELFTAQPRALYSGIEIGIKSQLIAVSSAATRYLPMIDFVGKPSIEELKELCSRALTALPSGSRHELYSSGNSYHAYFSRACDKYQYNNFMRILAASQIVDQQWVTIGSTPRTPTSQTFSYGDTDRQYHAGSHILRWTSLTGLKGQITKVTNVR